MTRKHGTKNTPKTHFFHFTACNNSSFYIDCKVIAQQLQELKNHTQEGMFKIIFLTLQQLNNIGPMQRLFTTIIATVLCLSLIHI